MRGGKAGESATGAKAQAAYREAARQGGECPCRLPAQARARSGAAFRLHRSRQRVGREARQNQDGEERLRRILSSFRSKLRYKAIAHGATFEEVDESGSTQSCSACGSKDSTTRPKGIAGLRVREWACDGCGVVHDRDTNAALNILRCGRASPAVGIRPFRRRRTSIDFRARFRCGCAASRPARRRNRPCSRPRARRAPRAAARGGTAGRTR